MRSKTYNRELWYSFAAILIITVAYLFVLIWYGQIPRSREFFGHTIGILGFVLMLMTETLYSIRKRRRTARWGRMSSWLEFHIFTGLVGPYMVLLHSSWKFNGLAGVVMLLTVIIVLSGFIGRYIYTALPRTADGVEIETNALEAQITQLNNDLQQWLSTQPEEALRRLSDQLSVQPSITSNRVMLVIGRGLFEFRQRLIWRRMIQKLDSTARSKAQELESLLEQQRTLHRQLDSLSMARRMLALWHSIHIPIGMALFTAAFVHIVAAIYYATLLR